MSEPDDWVRVKWDLSPELWGVIHLLAGRLDVPTERVVLLAVGLLKVCSDAAREGKHVGWADDPDVLEQEITGLSGPALIPSP